MAFALLVSGCDDGASATHKETLYLFGTLVEVTIRGVPEDDARAAVRAIEGDFRRMHRDWHAWKPGELTRLNAAIAAGEPFEASPLLLPLIRRGKALCALSDGLFDPGIGKLVGLWGFHADELPVGSLPSFQAIEGIVAQRPSIRDLAVDGAIVTSANPAVQLDFGGFAKGAALDHAMARLKEFGIRDAIVNAGGDLNTMGRAGDRPWRVGIRHPRNWGVIASLELEEGEVVYTSGNYERFREHEGIRYPHIIDPRDGMPVRHIASATVVGRDGTLADAAATALVVAGPQAWQRIAESMGVEFALLVDAEGTIYATPAMAARVGFEEGEPKRLIVGQGHFSAQ